MTLIKARTSLFLLKMAICISMTHCLCRHSYVTICDTFQDLKIFEDTGNINDLLIGSENGGMNLTPVNLIEALDLERCEHLRTIYIVRVISELEASGSNNKYKDFALNSLIIYGNILKKIEPRQFPQISLKRLSLVNNQIEVIKPGAFHGLQVEEIDLSDNKIESIGDRTLPDGVKIISFKNNKIRNIGERSIPQSTVTLNLEKNLFGFYLPDKPFEVLVNLKELKLSDNGLITLPKLNNFKELRIFDISYNSVTLAWVGSGLFQNNSHLMLADLSFNRISTSLVLQKLYTPEIHKKLTILLVGNRLKSLDYEEEQLEDKTFALYGNPWECCKYEKMMGMFRGHVEKCDLDFGSEGNIPYCLGSNNNNDTNSHYFDDHYSSELATDRFQLAVKNNENAFKCLQQLKKRKLKEASWY